MKFTQRIGFLLLAIYLIIVGLSGLIRFTFEGMGVILSALAIAAGIFILIDR
jgi:hypothetical protein